MPVAASEHSVLQLLRVATRAEHAAIEAALGLDGAFDLARYIAALRAFDAFLHLWEPRASAALPVRLRPWFEVRRRGHLARADLSLLGASTQRVPCDAVMPVASQAQALGAMYVVEGSCLGGQVIARRAADRFGIGVDNGGSFFGARGAATQPLWRQFCERPELEVGADSIAREQACRAAVLAFAQQRAIFEALQALSYPA